MVAALLLVRSWVGGDDGGQANGDCGGGRRPRQREKEERELTAEKELGGTDFFQFCTRFSSYFGHGIHTYYRKWKRTILSILGKTFSH